MADRIHYLGLNRRAYSGATGKDGKKKYPYQSAAVAVHRCGNRENKKGELNFQLPFSARTNQHSELERISPVEEQIDPVAAFAVTTVAVAANP